MRAACRLLLAAMPRPARPVGRADEITDQLEQARPYYEEGDVDGRHRRARVRRSRPCAARSAQALLATFPEPPAGWTAEPPATQAGGAMPFMAAGTVLSRTYRAADGGGSIEAQLMSGGGFLQGLAGMFMNPQPCWRRSPTPSGSGSAARTPWSPTTPATASASSCSISAARPR